MRVTERLWGPTDAEKLEKVSTNIELDFFVVGEIHKYFKLNGSVWTAFGQNKPGGGDATIAPQVLDAIARFEPDPAINVWFGRMIVPIDRPALSGPWGHPTWFYPGSFVPYVPPVTPKFGALGRSDGVTVWGQLGGGTFKYYAGAFDLHNAGASPLFSGRMNLALLNPEPGYTQRSAYYGTKDVISIGVGAQSQRNGSVGPAPVVPMGVPPQPAPTANYTGFSVDLIAEKTFSGVGTPGIGGTFNRYYGDYQAIEYSYYAFASFLTPNAVGFGKFMPVARFQQAKPKNAEAWTMLEGQLTYVISNVNAFLALGYQRTKVNGVPGNVLYFGIQLWTL